MRTALKKHDQFRLNENDQPYAYDGSEGSFDS